jgi:hypothetical protein
MDLNTDMQEVVLGVIRARANQLDSDDDRTAISSRCAEPREAVDALFMKLDGDRTDGKAPSAATSTSRCP